MKVRLVIVVALIFGISAVAQAQGNGPGFHVSATGDLNCPGGQTLSLPAPPASLGPITIPCTSGQGIAAAEAGVSGLRALGRSEHACCGTASGGNGSARIQIDNVVITGPPAASIPVSLNFHLRGTITGNTSVGQNGLFLLVRFLGNTTLSSFSQLEVSPSGIYNQTGVFAPLTVGFPQGMIDQAFVTPAATAAPNQPLALEIQLQAGTAMAGEGFTETDFFSGGNGFSFPFGVPVFNLPPGYTIDIPQLNIFNNFVVLPTLFSGDIFVVGSNASEISLPGVRGVTGSINIDGNTSATGINLSDLDSVGRSINIDGNTSATGIDLASLATVGGDVAIANNSACSTVALGVLATVVGNLTVESCGTGTFAPGPVAAGGNTTLRTTGYTAVKGTTGAGNTTITTGTSDAFMTVALRAGTFTTPVSFAITEVDPNSLVPQGGIGEGGEPATIDPIAAYQITFAVPTLNHDASLTFDVVVADLDDAPAEALLAALEHGTATLATLGDSPGSQYRAFPICSGGQLPSDGGCVLVERLDASGQPTTTLPAVVRFSNVVGHFSTWAVVIVTPQPLASNVFNGLLPPFPAAPYATTPTFKHGSVVPLKFTWLDASGTLIDSAAAAPAVTIYPASCTSQAPTTEPITPEDAGGSGGLRYDASTRTWIFNWNTRPLEVGCFSVRVTTENPQYGAPTEPFPVALRNR